MILSLIIPGNNYSIESKLGKELDGIEVEIIRGQWQDGLKEAEGKFICFFEENASVSPGFFFRNLFVYLSKPHFRKLAMVSPGLELLDQDITSYGYRYNNNLIPVEDVGKRIRNVQIGPVTGAIIRRSSLEGLDLDWGAAPLELSVDLSIKLWQNGLRVQVNPFTIYQTENNLLSNIKHTDKIPQKVQTIWQREMI